MEQAARRADLLIEGDVDKVFSMRPAKNGAMDALLPVLELYPEEMRDRLSFTRPADRQDAIWIHPGEPVFEGFRTLVTARLSAVGKRGAVFVDPTADRPYLFHMALLSVVRQADTGYQDLAREEVLECRLVGVKQYEGAEIVPCPVEHLLLLKGGHGIPAIAQRLAVSAGGEKDLAFAYLTERVAREMAVERRQRLIAQLPSQEKSIQRGFDFQEMELATARAKHGEKARTGNRKAVDALEEVKRQQRLLAGRRDDALASLRRVPELVAPGAVTFIAHALVVPSTDPQDIEQHEMNIELAAMRIARAFEEASGAIVKNVHTPETARLAGLPDNPGFDLLSIRPGNERRAIEVKGRGATGDVEVTANEWAKACNMRDGYWLYAVYDCASPAPRLVRVRDPFGSLLVKAKGSVLISSAQIADVAER